LLIVFVVVKSVFLNICFSFFFLFQGTEFSTIREIVVRD